MESKIQVEKRKGILSHMEEKPKLIVSILFIFFILIGFLSFRDFGLPWDEYEEHNIMLSNMKEYVRVFAKDSETMKLLSDVQDITSYEEKDHGESMYYGVAIIERLFSTNVRQTILIRHIYTYLIFISALFCLYLSVKFLTKKWKIGLLASLFVFLTPRFFAENFYNNKDMILFSLVLITFWFGLKFIETKRILYGCLFAIAGAFASNTRIIGFFLIAIIGLFYILTLIFTKSFHKKTFISGLITVLVFFAFFLAITPASWQSPIEYFKYTLKTSTNFTRWFGYILYQGKIYNPDTKQLPWHYIPHMFTITTPLLLVFFIIFGHLTSIVGIIRTKGKKIFESEQKYYLIALLFVWIPLIFAIKHHSNLYNGWRHFYFMYGPFMIIALGGIDYLYKHLHGAMKYLLHFIVAIHVLYFSFVLISMHPNQYAYYNLLAHNQEDQYEYDYWNVSAAQCIKQLLDKTDADVVTISARDWYAHDCLEKVDDFLPEKYAKRLEVLSEKEVTKADYVLSNSTYTNLIKVAFTSDKTFDLIPYNYEKKANLITSVKANGVTLMEIYQDK